MEKINFQGPICSTGYGVVAYNFWKELSKQINVTLWPTSGTGTFPVEPDQATQIRFLQDKKKQDHFDPTLPFLKIWHEHALESRIGTGEYFAFPFFEVNKFNSRRISHLNSVDKIIVSSYWGADIIKRNLGANKPVYVCNCGVDTSLFNKSLNVVNKEKCVFLNCGKWEVRKGHDILYKAFNDAFGNNERVELQMMTSNPFLRESEVREWEKLYSADNIKILPRVQYQNELAQIMGKAYCGVFPSRSEGWNMELLEMMAMGKHLIATDYSAHTEFCSNDNTNLIDIVEEEPMYDGKWFVGDNGTWASLEGEPYDKLVLYMRHVYRLWLDDPYKINQDGINDAEEFNWASVSHNLKCIVTGEE